MARPWNANIQYDAMLASLVPAGARSVLDVGCGDGFLAARLAERVPYVVGLDVDEPVLSRAATRSRDAGVCWRRGNVLADDGRADWARPGGFDAVLSNATLHHLSST